MYIPSLSINTQNPPYALNLCIHIYVWICSAHAQVHIYVYSLSPYIHRHTKNSPNLYFQTDIIFLNDLLLSLCFLDIHVVHLILLCAFWVFFKFFGHCWLCWLCSWTFTSGPSECKLHSSFSFFSLFSGVCDILLSRESQKMTLNCWLKNNPNEYGVHLSIYIQEICFSVSVHILLVFNILFKTDLFCLCVEKLFLDRHVDIYMHENLIWEKVSISKRMKSITDIYKIYNLNQNIY